jgi:hypothetical protein
VFAVVALRSQPLSIAVKHGRSNAWHRLAQITAADYISARHRAVVGDHFTATVGT